MVDYSIVNGTKSTTRIIPLRETTYNELCNLNYLCVDGECDFDSIIVFLIEHCIYLERMIKTKEELHDLCRVFEDNWRNE